MYLEPKADTTAKDSARRARAAADTLAKPKKGEGRPTAATPIAEPRHAAATRDAATPPTRRRRHDARDNRGSTCAVSHHRRPHRLSSPWRSRQCAASAHGRPVP